MKSNFKKLAVLAGATAAMATGSMSAQAVITSVPAPAQLIPLFYYNSNPGALVDTAVRVIVPKSVGADTVIGLLAGAASGGIQPSTSWNTSVNTVGTQIHRFFMNYQSAEVYNDAVSVTPDDEYYFNAASVSGYLTSGTPYYLILTNQSAYLGGAPTFQFSASAWVENDMSGHGSITGGLASVVNIPVLGLTDTADSTTYPTPTNNVIENYPTSAGGPISSPIHTAMRTSTTVPGMIYRVIDVPVHNSAFHNNTLVAWADRNASSSSVNGLSGKLFAVNTSEVMVSLGTYSFPYQLNIVKLGYTGTNPLGITDSYAAVQTISNIGNASGGGFLKLVGDAVPLPGSNLPAGAYSSVILFNVPADNSLSFSTINHDSSEVATDTGFFTSN